MRFENFGMSLRHMDFYNLSVLPQKNLRTLNLYHIHYWH